MFVLSVYRVPQYRQRNTNVLRWCGGCREVKCSNEYTSQYICIDEFPNSCTMRRSRQFCCSTLCDSVSIVWKHKQLTVIEQIFISKPFGTKKVGMCTRACRFKFHFACWVISLVSGCALFPSMEQASFHIENFPPFHPVRCSSSTGWRLKFDYLEASIWL